MNKFRHPLYAALFITAASSLAHAGGEALQHQRDVKSVVKRFAAAEDLAAHHVPRVPRKEGDGTDSTTFSSSASSADQYFDDVKQVGVETQHTRLYPSKDLKLSVRIGRPNADGTDSYVSSTLVRRGDYPRTESFKVIRAISPGHSMTSASNGDIVPHQSYATQYHMKRAVRRTGLTSATILEELAGHPTLALKLRNRPMLLEGLKDGTVALDHTSRSDGTKSKSEKQKTFRLHSLQDDEESLTLTRDQYADLASLMDRSRALTAVDTSGDL